MHLKGFKSFAKPLDMEFSKGFSTIIGPNGSGKSNIMDALCFVLGKISAKSMRAEKSANLIWNGGKKGNAMKEAEVSIFFDNDQKEFPLDDKEIKISRILKQPGQSVYKINGEQRTRQQVVEVLSSAKVDPNGHNIILQGDIVRFMEMKTDDRREMIEEIAGISMYEDRKIKAMSELTKVDGRLNEATIILTERESYLRELKKERDQAVKYRDLEKNVKSNKATFLHLQIVEKVKKKEEIESKIKKHEVDIEKINAKIKETKVVIQKKKDELENVAHTIEEKGEKESVLLQKDLENIKTDMVKQSERLNTCKNEISKVQERKKQLQETVSDVENTITDLKKSKNDLDERIRVLTTKETKDTKEVKAFKLKHGVADSASDFDNVEKEVENLSKNVQEIQVEQQELLQRKFQIEAQITQLDEKIKGLQSLTKGMSIDKLQKTVDSLDKSLRKCLNEDSFFASQLGEVKDELMKKEEQLFVLQAQDAGRKSSLMNNAALKKILSLKNPGIFGTVSQLGKVDKKYALALEVAAGSRMNNVVVHDEKIAAECIKLLKKERLGTATFLPINKLKARITSNVRGSGVIGNALDLVSFDSKFKNVFSFALGNAVVVDSLDTARRIGVGKARMVTLEGDLTEMSGAMIGGFRHKSRGVGFQEKSVAGSSSDLELSISKLEKVKAALEKRRAENHQDIDRFRQEKSVLEGDLIKAEKSIGSVDIRALKQERDVLVQDEVFHDLKNIESNLAAVSLQLITAKKDKEKMRASMKDLRHPEIAATLDKLELKRQKSREEIVQLNTEMKNIDTQITNIYLPEKEKTLQIIKQHDKEVTSFVEEAKKLEGLVKDHSKILKEKESKSEKFKKEYKDLFVRRNKLNEETQKRESSISIEDMKIKEIANRMNEKSIARAKIVGELEGLEKEFEEFKGVPLRRQISAEKLKDDIKKFEVLIQKIGNVNLRALEVYEDILKEYESLLGKADKLKSEKDDVLEMIDEIEGKKKDLFLTTFKEIAKNFANIFSSLSAKGDAMLLLEDKDDPLSAGVDIRVRLLGNKFLDIKSLSGGEKTMTALAFIFAIQECKPGSFYILDEVDAALDKKNSELLSKLVARYANRAQYILISHNDAVISEAEQIYGVSMQQTGMSKVVSLKI